MTHQYRIVDADGHVLEPPDLWQRYLEPEYRDRAPELFCDTDGKDRLRIESVQGEPWRVLGGEWGFGDTGTVDRKHEKKPGAVHGSTHHYSDGRPGGFDPHARIADLDLDGIDAVFLYPTLGLHMGAIVDPELGAAACRAYNIWLSEYCSPYPERLFGVGMLPMQSIAKAVDEARFVRQQLGFRAAFLRPKPVGDRLLSDPEYDELWAVLQDLDLSVGIHEGTSQAGATIIGSDRIPHGMHSPLHIVSHTLEMMCACLNIIWGGVCDRFPNLRFGFLESGGGWMPAWLDRMDRHYDDPGFNDTGLSLRPSDYFRRQCWISFEPPEGTLPSVVDYLGATKILWATDYPHGDGFFPGAPDMIAQKLPEAVRQQVLAQGAIDFYRLGS